MQSLPAKRMTYYCTAGSHAPLPHPRRTPAPEGCATSRSSAPADQPAAHTASAASTPELARLARSCVAAASSCSVASSISAPCGLGGDCDEEAGAAAGPDAGWGSGRAEQTRRQAVPTTSASRSVSTAAGPSGTQLRSRRHSGTSCAGGLLGRCKACASGSSERGRVRAGQASTGARWTGTCREVLHKVHEPRISHGILKCLSSLFKPPALQEMLAPLLRLHCGGPFADRLQAFHF